MVNIEECKAAGLDPAMVNGYCKKLEKLLAAMRKDGLMLFGGGDGSTVRPYQREPDTSRLIVGSIAAQNIDGGAGASHFDEDGLQRGE